MRSGQETGIRSFYFLFAILIAVIALAGKVIVDLKTLEIRVCRAESQWVSLYETSVKLFSFSSLRSRPERNRDIIRGRDDLKDAIERWRAVRDQFEGSLHSFQTSPYQILFSRSTGRHIAGAWEAWLLTKRKLDNSHALFEKILATPVGETLGAYSYKELIEEAVARDTLKARRFSKGDLFLFYRLQDSLSDLEISGGVFENVLRQISRDVSRRMGLLIVLIGGVVLCIIVFIVSLVLLIGRRIKDSQKKFQAIFDQTFQFTGLLTPGGILLEANQTAMDFTGAVPSDVLGKPFWTGPWWRHSREVAEQVHEAITRAARGEFIRREISISSRDGCVGHIDFSVKPVFDDQHRVMFLIPEGRDITDRKQAEQKLKEYHEHLEDLVQARTAELTEVNERLKSEIARHQETEAALGESREYLNRIINSLADPVFVKDRSHAWVLLNDMFCQLIGKTREQLVGKSDYDFFPEKEAAVFWAKDEEVFTSGRENINEEFFTDGEGRTRTIVTKKTLYTDQAGKKFLVGIIRDITEIREKSTELKSAYEKLVALQVRMVHAEKMASLGQLAAGIAHEINNPTAYILCNLATLRDYEKNMSEFLKRVVALSPDLERHERLAHELNIPRILEDCPQLVEDTVRGAERIKKIVQDLRVFAHPDVGGLEYGDLHHCIDGAIGILGAELKPRIEVVKKYGAVPPVRFKEQQILQVFINLLSNAIHAIKDQGQIVITTEATGAHVVVEVADTGCGIPPDMLDKVFDPFFTTKPVGQGTGLGLSVVHGIIQQHQGSIALTSSPGSGTTFTIRLLKDGPVLEGE